jgi:branched-chain amino acid transport system substrate-binding protein
LGKEMLASAQLAIDEANKSGRSPGIELIARDDRGSAASAALACRSMIQDPSTVAVVAAGTSAIAKAIIEAGKRDNMPVLTSTATASDLLDVGGAVFRVIPPNSAQAEALAGYARVTGAKSAGILFQQDDYATDLKDAFKRSFAEKGGKVVGEVPFESSETDFRSQLDHLVSLRPGIILAAAQHVPVARIIIRAREKGIRQPIIAGETAFTDKLLAAIGGTSPGPFYLIGAAVDLDSPPPALDSFIKTFAARNGKRPGIYGSYTYDTVSLVTHLLATGNVHNRQELASQLRALRQYYGVTGPINFDARGDVRRSYSIYTIRNAAFAPVADNSSVIQ